MVVIIVAVLCNIVSYLFILQIFSFLFNVIENSTYTDTQNLFGIRKVCDSKQEKPFFLLLKTIFFFHIFSLFLKVLSIQSSFSNNVSYRYKIICLPGYVCV